MSAKTSPTELPEEYKRYCKIFGSCRNLGFSFNPGSYIYQCDNGQTIDSILERAHVERLLSLTIAPFFDSYPLPVSHATKRIKAKHSRIYREEQTLKNLLGKTLPRGPSQSSREKSLLQVAKLCWFVWIGVEDIQKYPSLDSIIKSVILTPGERRSLLSRQIEARIKPVRRAFNRNRDRLLRQVSMSGDRLTPHEQKDIAEIHERLAALKIIPRKLS